VRGWFGRKMDGWTNKQTHRQIVRCMDGRMIGHRQNKDIRKRDGNGSINKKKD
jgi:hypothetical protein